MHERTRTIPLRAPLMVVSRLHLCSPSMTCTYSLLAMRQVKAENEPEMIVLIQMVATVVPLLPVAILIREPPLKAKKPKKRMNPPREASCQTRGFIKLFYKILHRYNSKDRECKGQQYSQYQHIVVIVGNVAY